MNDRLRADAVEPETTTVRTFAVRRDDDDLNTFVDTIIELLEHDGVLVDLSRHDHRADLIELRVSTSEPRSQT
ncbi:hypothetical protein RB614_31690 [Phytohabitans sp. ZYX-F-186]|uniref:Uncharacterized protein n=1 Tax=Phytohabitans maris TaxID=3071409 RepID=A0ABU0ZS68_9ACTN|nr:hypothetical protein [Phytohabitans sp. ZYX-F-186]MDQ7909095.1 hypothetical protein [Phytohabitans sp. ZYX-F-186]